MKHFNEISIAKGIALLLMVLGHSGIVGMPRDFIYLFHMPLFFILSGYCFNEKRLDDWKQYVWGKIKSLYLPFVKYGLVFLLLHNVFYHYHIYGGPLSVGNGSEYYSLGEIANRIIKLFVTMNSGEQLLGAYWFLHSLFFGVLIFYCIRKVFNSDVLICSLLLLLTLFTVVFKDVYLPFFSIGHKEVFSAFYISIGYMIRKRGILSYCDSTWFNSTSLILLLVGSYYLHLEMMQCTIMTITPYVVLSVVGTIWVLNISKWLLKKVVGLSRFLSYVSDKGISIVTWHFISFKIVTIIYILNQHLSMDYLSSFPVCQEKYLWGGVFHCRCFSTIGD